MNACVRWGKFGLVGAMGAAVQLAALTAFDRWMGAHHLYASAAAVQLALLHNFVWHVHYTWRDRHDDTRVRQFARFQISNGAVSLIGNLVVMRLLTEYTHLPLLVSNGAAIVCCSIANFCLGNNWAFGESGVSVTRRGPADLSFDRTPACCVSDPPAK